MKKILPPILLLIAIAAMSVLHGQWPIATIIPRWIRIPATVLVVLGLALASTQARRFARLGTNLQTFNDPDVLVVDGLFRYSRNPMYLGFAIALLGIALALGSAAALLVWASFVVITDRWYIAFEERVMTRKFGTAYLEYQQRTRRWL